MIDYELFKILGISIGLGLLVGLQREYDEHKMAGIRTFTLVTVFGSIMGLLSKHLNDGLVVAAGALCLVILVATVNYFKHQRKQNPDIGQTTEVAFLLMYALGAYLVFFYLSLGVAIGGVIAVLLHLKSTLAGFVERLKQKDVRAIMQFVAISLVILPILPDQNYGPYAVLNPHDIWLMVVLIVGLGLVGYLIYKILGKNAGTIANGLLGGMISSTATTVTFSRQASQVPKAARLAAFVIMTASMVSLIRVMIEVAVVSPNYLGAILPPLLAELVFMIILCVWLYYFNQREQLEELPEPRNPAQLKSALVFGALYALILLGVAAAKDYLGQSGLYIVSIVSGLTDMDAITLSLSSSLNRGEIESHLTWKLILVASLANLVFKGGMASALGTPKLAKIVWILFGLSIASGILVVLLWPEQWSF